MPRGDTSGYTGKHQRQAQHIAKSLEERGVPGGAAEARAWVNKQAGGGKVSGSGSGRGDSRADSARKRWGHAPPQRKTLIRFGGAREQRAPSGGLWRRQAQTDFLDQIGRVVGFDRQHAEIADLCGYTLW